MSYATRSAINIATIGTMSLAARAAVFDEWLAELQVLQAQMPALEAAVTAAELAYQVATNDADVYRATLFNLPHSYTSPEQIAYRSTLDSKLATVAARLADIASAKSAVAGMRTQILTKIDSDDGTRARLIGNVGRIPA